MHSLFLCSNMAQHIELHMYSGSIPGVSSTSHWPWHLGLVLAPHTACGTSDWHWHPRRALGPRNRPSAPDLLWRSRLLLAPLATSNSRWRPRLALAPVLALAPQIGPGTPHWPWHLQTGPGPGTPDWEKPLEFRSRVSLRKYKVDVDARQLINH